MLRYFLISIMNIEMSVRDGQSCVWQWQCNVPVRYRNLIA